MPTAASAQDVSVEGDGDAGSWGAPADPAAEAAAVAKFQAAARVSLSPIRINTLCPVSTGLNVGIEAETNAICGTPPAAKTLQIAHQTQQTGYWCGPTTVAMASAYAGTNQSQQAIATYIGTTTAGSDRNQVARGLRWVTGEQGYTPITAPNNTVFRGALISTIGKASKPIAVNTHELSGGAHYNGHPNRDIGHFILGVGYHSGGGYGVYNDPAAGLASYPNSSGQFTLLTTTMVTYVDDRGIIA
jgi:hypothetical protein